MLPWNFTFSKINSIVHSGSTNVQRVHISTFGIQQYWITEIAKNDRVAFVATYIVRKN